MSTIFDFLNTIIFDKNNEITIEENDFNLYMVNRWLSMYSPDMANVINETSNKYGQTLAIKEDQFKFLLNMLPKQRRKHIMYIKKKKEDKQKKDNEVDFVTLIATKLEISKREIEVSQNDIDESVNNIICYIHDDLVLDSNNITKRLNRLFDTHPSYGVIGLAGTDILSNGMWWSDSTKMYGQVKHMHEGTIHRNDYSGTFGDTLKEVVTIDGLFFAIDKSKIKHRFDEDFKEFHFYDLSFCVPNFLDGVKIGVTTKILVTHLSIGETNKQWDKNKLFFEAKYYQSFPITVKL